MPFNRNPAAFNYLCALVVVILLITGGCTFGNNQSKATIVVFVEQEQGTEPYRTRMIVTRNFLRMDDGDDASDFLLFNRKTRVIYNTNSSDRSILVIPAQHMNGKPPFEIKNKAVSVKSELPDIDGKIVSEYRLLSNDTECYHLFAVKGILENVKQALREYRQALAGEQINVLANMPVAMQTACDLSNNIFMPARHLKHGFPIRLQEMTGRLRELVGYEDKMVSKDLFILPEGFGEYSTHSLQ
jgi:hypothetical protein